MSSPSASEAVAVATLTFPSSTSTDPTSSIVGAEFVGVGVGVVSSVDFALPPPHAASREVKNATHKKRVNLVIFSS